MQICTRLHWRNAKVKSDGSGSKGLTLCSCLCYRCCALEQSSFKDAHGSLKGAKQPARPCGPLLLKIDSSSPATNSASPSTWGNETRTQTACASVPIRIVLYSYMWLYHVQYCTMFLYCKCSLWNTFQVLYTSIVICNTGPYYTNRHQGWSNLNTAFTELTSKFPYLSQSAKIWF